MPVDCHLNWGGGKATARIYRGDEIFGLRTMGYRKFLSGAEPESAKSNRTFPEVLDVEQSPSEPPDACHQDSAAAGSHALLDRHRLVESTGRPARSIRRDALIRRLPSERIPGSPTTRTGFSLAISDIVTP